MANQNTSDWAQYEHLFQDASLSFADISAKTGKSLDAVRKKYNRLVEQGAIMLSEDELLEQSIEQQKTEIQERAERNLKNRLLRERGEIQLLIDALKESAAELPLIKPRLAAPAKTVQGDEEEVVLLFGDTQIGEVVDPLTTGGLGHYNRDVFQSRLDTLRLKVEKIIRSHQTYQPINTLNIFGLGDFVEGMDIYQGQSFHIDMHVIHQVLWGAQLVADFIVYLLGVVGHINLFGVLGNHGRIGRKGQFPTTASMDFLFLKQIEIILAKYIEEGLITAEFPETWFQLVERMDQRFLLVHGDDIRSWMSIPFYGADRAVSRWNDLINQKFDFFIFGHHHTHGEWEKNAKEVIANASFVGTNEYSAKQLNVGGRPSQKMFAIHPDHGKTWQYRLMLDDNEPEREIIVYKGG
jgi:hypothetical protein